MRRLYASRRPSGPGGGQSGGPQGPRPQGRRRGGRHRWFPRVRLTPAGCQAHQHPVVQHRGEPAQRAGRCEGVAPVQLQIATCSRTGSRSAARVTRGSKCSSATAPTSPSMTAAIPPPDPGTARRTGRRGPSPRMSTSTTWPRSPRPGPPERGPGPHPAAEARGMTVGLSPTIREMIDSDAAARHRLSTFDFFKVSNSSMTGIGITTRMRVRGLGSRRPK